MPPSARHAACMPGLSFHPFCVLSSCLRRYKTLKSFVRTNDGADQAEVRITLVRPRPPAWHGCLPASRTPACCPCSARLRPLSAAPRPAFPARTQTFLLLPAPPPPAVPVVPAAVEHGGGGVPSGGAGARADGGAAHPQGGGRQLRNPGPHRPRGEPFFLNPTGAQGCALWDQGRAGVWPGRRVRSGCRGGGAQGPRPQTRA